MTREDLQQCRHRLGKLLLRRGLHYTGRNWTRAHRQWIDSLAWAHPAERAVVDDYLLAIDHTEARFLELDARLAEIAEHEPYRAAGRVVAAPPGQRHQAHASRKRQARVEPCRRQQLRTPGHEAGLL